MRLWPAIVIALILMHAGLLVAFAQVRPLPDQILVKFRPRVSEARAKGVFRPLRGRQTHAIGPIGVRVLRVPADQRDVVLASLRRHPDVEFAEADACVEPDFLPDDEFYPVQWHLPKISAPAAWDSTTGSGEVIVAIIDSGVDATHPDLAALITPGWNIYGNNRDTSDVQGHGTALAGAAVCRGNNRIGVAAVAWQCRIMPIRVSNANGGATYSAMAQGLIYAADHGARVANVSYTGAARSATVQSAAAYLRERGGLTTASSGNDGRYVDEPDHPAVLVVGATTSTDTLAVFSNRGPFVDLAAPGSGIYTTAWGGGYGYRYGTSLAAPIVAGVAALVFSANPALSPAEVETILERSAVDLGPAGRDAGFGNGRVHAHRAVAAALPSGPPPDTTPPVVKIVSPAAGARLQPHQKIYVTAADNTGVARVELRVDGWLLASTQGKAQGGYWFTWNTTKLSRGKYTLQAVAYDGMGNAGMSPGVLVIK